MRKCVGAQALPTANFLEIAAIWKFFHTFLEFFTKFGNFVPILDFFLAIFGTFWNFLLILLEILAIYICRDHAFFAAICVPPKFDRHKFVSFLMSVRMSQKTAPIKSSGKSHQNTHKKQYLLRNWQRNTNGMTSYESKWKRDSNWSLWIQMFPQCRSEVDSISQFCLSVCLPTEVLWLSVYPQDPIL